MPFQSHLRRHFERAKDEKKTRKKIKHIQKLILATLVQPFQLDLLAACFTRPWKYVRGSNIEQHTRSHFRTICNQLHAKKHRTTWASAAQSNIDAAFPILFASNM